MGSESAGLRRCLRNSRHGFATSSHLIHAYSGLASKTCTQREYRFVKGQLKHFKKLLVIRGLNANHDHNLKNLFKSGLIRGLPSLESSRSSTPL
jgi:hypothetical protein